MFFLVGMGVALVYFIVGTVAQVLLQRRPPKVSLGIDLGLALLLGLLLAYGGVTAHYLDESPTRPEADTTAHAPPPRR